ncbi:hypothetical protein MVES1_002033 [Malassezia vespertilionis]|uniref:uncharacterized protein n=1 Tax=Malassezia vespertilionis TaxID=2020962 RepID=UPI0024B1E171|nr:uncharacterized protein MVES1_002033 [Malassezia vespertilionis]WFD06679.1 hypothetical protein MVES1_002033 [Malassezia vespertilionis]
MSPQNGGTKLNMCQKRKQTMVPKLMTSPASVESPSPLKKDAKTIPVRTSPEPQEEPRPNPQLQSSLGDLSLAVFLESLYTLEIAASDGLTSNMLLSSGAQLEIPPPISAPQTDMFDNGATLINSFESTPNTMLYKTDTPERKSGYPESAFLRDGLAFSVPSDFSWWNTDGLAMSRNTTTNASDIQTGGNFVVPSEMETNGAPAAATSMHGVPFKALS